LGRFAFGFRSRHEEFSVISYQVSVPEKNGKPRQGRWLRILVARKTHACTMTAFWHRRGFERAVAKHRMVDIVDGQKAGAPVARGGRRDRDAASRAYEAARFQPVSWLDAARAGSEDVNFVQRMRLIALPDRSVVGIIKAESP
jgi:hypothetical protein